MYQPFKTNTRILKLALLAGPNFLQMNDALLNFIVRIRPEVLGKLWSSVAQVLKIAVKVRND